MRTSKVLAAAALATTALLAVSACGGSAAGTASSTEAAATSEPAGNGVADKSAEQILKAAQEAARAQSSVHVQGTVSVDGQKTTMDLRLDKSGKARTTMSMGGSEVEIISTGKKAYVRGNKEFWVTQTEAGEEGYKLFKDKWLVASSSDAMGQLGPMADFTTMIDELLKPSGTISKGSTSDIEGSPAIGLLDGTTGTLWISTTGEPLPLQIENKDGTLSFTDWSKPLKITEPDPDVVIDPNKVGQ